MQPSFFLARVAGVLARAARTYGDGMWQPRRQPFLADTYDLWYASVLPRTQPTTRCCNDLAGDFGFTR